MGDKNNVKEVEATDATIKSGHGVLKSIYVTKPGTDVWIIRDGTSSVQATGTVTVACVVACDTVTVNGLVYTAVCGAKCGDTEFSICTSDCAVATDLADSIDDDVRTGTTQPLFDQVSTATCAVVTITVTAGQDGNLICLSSTGGTATVSGAFLTGGTGQKILTVEADEDGGYFSAPYVNHPVALGIQVDHISGAGSAITIVYE